MMGASNLMDNATIRHVSLVTMANSVALLDSMEAGVIGSVHRGALIAYQTHLAMDVTPVSTVSCVPKTVNRHAKMEYVSNKLVCAKMVVYLNILVTFVAQLECLVRTVVQNALVTAKYVNLILIAVNA